MPKRYSKKCLSIRRLKDLAYRLGFPLWLIEQASDNTKQYYIFWSKKKPNGKSRELCKVKSPLKDIQKAIHRLLMEVRHSDSVHGGLKGKSHVTNASVHCKKQTLLNL